MLEEGLRSPTFSPAEAAQGLLAFIRFELSDGGATAEKRFITLFSLLCDRLYGPLSGPSDGFRHEVGGWLSRQTRWERSGGNRKSGTTSPRSSSHVPHLQRPPSVHSDPVFQLLCGMQALSGIGGTNKSRRDQQQNQQYQQQPLQQQQQQQQFPTLLEAIVSNTAIRRGVRIQFTFQALPKPTREVLVEMIKSVFDGKQVDTSGRQNAARLFGELLQVPIQDQRQILDTEGSGMMNGTRSDGGLLSLSPVRHYDTQLLGTTSSNINNTINGNPGNNSNNNNNNVVNSNGNGTVGNPMSNIDGRNTQTTKILLSMVEYFLLLFIRYPTAPPTPPQPAPQGRHPGTRTASRSRSKRLTAYGDVLYTNLFECYTRHFLPTGDPNKEFLGFPSLSRHSELFLRLVIEFWLCGDTRFITLTKAVAPIIERRKRQNPSDTTILTFDLDAMFDLVKVEYDPPYDMIQRCLKPLVVHLVKDANLTLAVNDQAIAGNNTSSTSKVWCASPAMTVMQQSFFTYLTSTFRHAPVHLSGSPFYTALDCWLLWLEPWNVELRKKSASTVGGFSSPTKAGTMLVNTMSGNSPTQYRSSPHRQHQRLIAVLRSVRSSSSSRYSKKWEPYIAANLHFYTLPLALFVRRARELDFSSAYLSRSFSTVKRVFRVFSPEVVTAINALLSTDRGGRLDLAPLVDRHNQLLGDFSPESLAASQQQQQQQQQSNPQNPFSSTPSPPPPPPPTPTSSSPAVAASGSVSLSSIGKDMHALLEEITVQHLKTIQARTFVDRIEVSIDNFFGSVESFLNSIGLAPPATPGTTGVEKDINRLVQQAKAIVGLPSEYEPLPHDSRLGTQPGGGTGAPKNRGMFGTFETPAVATSGEGRPERLKSGMLTERGREQILEGSARCDPLDVVTAFGGHGKAGLENNDQRYRQRMGPCEVPFLVVLTKIASDWLNTKLERLSSRQERTPPTDHSDNEPIGVGGNKVRVDLRFLADYRNLLLIGVVSWVYQSMR